MAVVVAFVAWLAPVAAAQAQQPHPDGPAAQRFVREVSVPRMVEHETALQRIASLNGDTREVFSAGYRASVDYVVETLEDAGYDPQVTMFDYPIWTETQPSVLNLVSPAPKVYRPGTAADDNQPTADFIAMANSPTAELSAAPVFPVGGIVDPPTGGSASGCTAADYAGVAGKVALVQRGTCPFVTKTALAEEAGATAVIIYNEGNTPDRQNPVFIENTADAGIPAVITSYAVGNELLQAAKAGQSPTVDLKVSGALAERLLPQVIAETEAGDPDNVVVVGAHLDSVPEGPGINDDGSGTAALLVMADRIARRPQRLRQKVRFAWWGAEENGLVGSNYYAHSLSQAEVDRIDVMLDFDMLASPNYVRFVYDGDGSAAPDNPAGPPGSGLVEQVFDDWFDARGLESEQTPFDGRSDYVGFTDRGIPAGGVTAGAEGEKTVAEEAVYGGAAGSYYDPCYHQLCDNLSTVLTGVPPLDAEGLAFYVDNATDADRQAARQKMAGGALRSLRELGGAAAYSVWYFATARDPFGAGARVRAARRRAARVQARRAGFRWQGPVRLRR